MNQISKLIKTNSKDDIKSYLTAVLIALVGGIVLALAKRKDWGSFKSGYLLSAAILIILVTAVFAFISILTSLDRTYPLANKLGFTRKEISFSLLIKDIILIIVTSLIIYALSHVFVGQVDTMPNYGSRILEFFANGKPSFTAIFTEVLIGIDFAIIASVIAYIIGFAPGPIGIILYVIFTAIINNNITNSPSYIFIALIIFAIAVIFRHIVIKKFDPKK